MQPLFERAGVDLDVRETKRAGHATELIRDLSLAKFDGICVVGGDGTAHEAVQGLMTRRPEDRIPIALIPAGTGNTLHHELGCEDPVAAVQYAIAGRTRSVDVARVSTATGTFYCINIVGFGAVADINRTAERLRWIGRARYPVAALWHILRPSPRRVRLTLDDHNVDGDFLFVIGCNTKSTGTKMQLAPDALLDDGLLDVVLLRDTSRLQILAVFLRSFNGSHLTMPCVECHQVRSFSLSSNFPEGLNLDGESAGSSPLSVEVESNSIEVFG